MKTEYVIGGVLLLIVGYFVLRPHPTQMQQMAQQRGMVDQTGHDFAIAIQGIGQIGSTIGGLFSHSGGTSTPQTTADTSGDVNFNPAGAAAGASFDSSNGATYDTANTISFAG